MKNTLGLNLMTVFPGMGPVAASDTQIRIASRRADAAALIANNPILKDATIVDMSNQMPWPLISNDSSIGYWGVRLIVGGFKKDEKIPITELVGDLMDRLENPRSPDFRDPQGKPGTILKLQMYPNELGDSDPNAPSGFGQLYWGV